MAQPERRQQPERRTPARSATIIVPYVQGRRYLRRRGYTGTLYVHMHEGKPKRIEIPNPEGW